MIKAVIFDMDGVLIDAKEWHFEALNKSLALYGYEITPKEHQDIYDGLPTSKKLDILSSSKGLPRDLHTEINQIKQNFTMELINKYCKPCAHHIHALTELKKMNYKLAVASNSIRHTVDFLMRKAQLHDYLDAIFSSSDVINPKPHPEIYLITIEKLGISASECLVVEDHEKGIAAAKAAGAHVLAVQSIHDVTLTAIMERLEELQ